MDKIVIKDSPIHGRGVFAAREIKPGEVIINWSTCSDVLSDADVAALPPDEHVFVSRIDGQNVLFHPPARFVNHSCQPNARGEKGRDAANCGGMLVVE